MSTVIDTTTAPPGDRFSMWQRVSAQAFEPMTLRAPRERAFAARLEHHRLASIQVHRLAADASVVTRTHEHIRRSDPNLLGIMLQVEGRCFVAQEGRDTLLGPGDLTYWHSSRPYVMGGDEPFVVLMVRIPQPLLTRTGAGPRDAVARQLDAGSAAVAVLGPYLTALQSGLDRKAFNAAAQGRLARSLLDLLHALGGAQPAHDGSMSLKDQVSEYIDAHLFDPELGPDRIAADHFISRSSLYRLFAADRAGIQGAIRRRRLEAARRDLDDPLLVDLPVADIAARCGFISAAHFTRVFRASYGLTPGKYRSRANERQILPDAHSHLAGSESINLSSSRG